MQIPLEGLIDKSKPILVAFSGGRDSVALLHFLCVNQCECIALHCNYHLRQEESNRDEDFVRQFCIENDINLIVRQFDTLAYCEQFGVSVEMAARELRYTWFEKIRKQLKAQAIAVAHHKDDQAETVMLNLIRGTGIRGLGGMKIENNHIVRPLLNTSRAEIESYLRENNLSWVDDSTNNETIYRRNKIRHDILPMMRTLNSNITDTLTDMAQVMQRTNNLLQYYVNQERQRFVTTDGDCAEIPILPIIEHPQGKELLYELIRDYGFSSWQSDLIYHSAYQQSGKRYLSATHELLKDRESLLIYPITHIDDVPQYEITKRKRNETEYFPAAKATTAFFDSKVLDEPLSLRHWQHGDKFYPLGMNESKKLSDFFTDCKYSIKKKRDTWLLLSGNEIVWVIGERIDNRYRVRHKSNEIVEIKINICKTF